MSPSNGTHSLLGLPTEILLDLFHHLNLNSIFNFSIAHRSLWDTFQQRKATILLPILAREFSPFDELLQVFTAKCEDLDAVGGLYKPRRIIFKRYPGDTGSILAASPEAVHLSSVGSQDGSTGTINTTKRQIPAPPSLKTVILTEKDLDAILDHCRLVHKWEGLFPQMRWLSEPENCRVLRPHEAMRFRRALYRWWLYGLYFHGDFPRPRIGFPEPYVEDIRTSQLRFHSTAELLELMDLAETMKDVVLHYICPRLDPDQDDEHQDIPLIESVDRPHSLLTSWNDQSCWNRIVKTYTKLGPKDLMFFFENIYTYHRKRLIAEIRAHHPNFVFDQESIQVAIRCALDERRWIENMPSLAEDSIGGIIDFDDERDEERVAFGNDASSDGSLPLGTRVIRSFSQYSPRGDDGSLLEEPQRQHWSGGRYLMPATLGIARQ